MNQFIVGISIILISIGVVMTNPYALVCGWVGLCAYYVAFTVFTYYAEAEKQRYIVAKALLAAIAGRKVIIEEEDDA